MGSTVRSLISTNQGLSQQISAAAQTAQAQAASLAQLSGRLSAAEANAEEEREGRLRAERELEQVRTDAEASSARLKAESQVGPRADHIDGTWGDYIRTQCMRGGDFRT